MKYLVVYPAAEGGKESKELLATEAEVKKFIENLLLKEKVGESQVSLYEIRPVDYQVERVPVVNIGGVSLPEMDKADIPEIITTEEEVEAEAAQTAATQEESANTESEREEEKLEVFTFES